MHLLNRPKLELQNGILQNVIGRSLSTRTSGFLVYFPPNFFLHAASQLVAKLECRAHVDTLGAVPCCGDVCLQKTCTYENSGVQPCVYILFQVQSIALKHREADLIPVFHSTYRDSICNNKYALDDAFHHRHSINKEGSHNRI